MTPACVKLTQKTSHCNGIPVITALVGLRQESYEFKASFYKITKQQLGQVSGVKGRKRGWGAEIVGRALEQ